MSTHDIPHGVDAQRWYETITALIREPSGIMFEDVDSPVFVEFTPDLTVNETVTYDALAQSQTTDRNERSDLLQLASAALTQIANDRTAIQASSIPLSVKVVVDNMLVREDRIIRVLRAIIRSGLD